MYQKNDNVFKNAMQIYLEAIKLVEEQKTSRARYLLEAEDGDFMEAVNSPLLAEHTKTLLRGLKSLLLD